MINVGSWSMNVVFLNYHQRSLTGGHQYNDAFLDYLSEISGTTIIKTPSCSALYPSWLKPLSPFLELKRLSLFSRNSVVFWEDSAHKYHYLLALITRLVKHVKSVVIIHHFPFLIENGWKLKLQQFFYSQYLKQIETIIVPSPYTLDLAQQLYPQKNIIYIPLPFKQAYCPSDQYEEGCFVYVGTVEPRKGLIYLIEALGIIKQQVPNKRFTLHIVGEVVDRHYAHQLITRAEQLNIRDDVVLKGRVSDEELNDYYQRAEIFTFPSLLEGYGIVLIEAFCRGVPVVCFNNSAMPYTVKDGINGLVAENRDAQSLAEKIMLLSGNQSLRKKFQEGIAKTMQELKTQEDFESGVRDMFESIKCP